jgi:hypothetical protein
MPQINIEYEFIDNLKQLLNQVDKTTNEMGKKFESVGSKMESGLGKSKTSINDIFAGTFAGNMATKFAEKLIGGAKQAFNFIKSETIKWEKETQKLQSVIPDNIQAGAMMEELDKISGGVIPIEELSDSYIRLINVGIKPTKKEMKSFADFAKAQGKSVSQYTASVASATMGQTKALREFGIQMTEVDGKLQVSFRGQKKTIENNKGAIKDYLTSLGQEQGIAGSIERSGGGVIGASAEFSGALERAGRNIGERFKGTFETFLGGLTTIVERIAEIAKVSEVDKEKQRREELRPVVKELQKEISKGSQASKEKIDDALNRINKIDPNFLSGVDTTNATSIQNRIVKYNERIALLEEKDKLETERQQLLNNDYIRSSQTLSENLQKSLAKSDVVKGIAKSMGYDITKDKQRKGFFDEYTDVYGGGDMIAGFTNLINSGVELSDTQKTTYGNLINAEKGISNNAKALEENARKLAAVEEKLEPKTVSTGAGEDTSGKGLGDEASKITGGSTVKELTITMDFSEKSIWVNAENIEGSAESIREIILNELRKVAQNVPSIIKT